EGGGLRGAEGAGTPGEPAGQGVRDAVPVVELRLRHRVVHVERGDRQLAGIGEAVEPVYPGGRLLADPAQRGRGRAEPAGFGGEARRERAQERRVLRMVAGAGCRDSALPLELK